MIVDSFPSVESRQDILELMRELQEALDNIPLKFVDIDTSYKEIDQDDLENYRANIAFLNSPELEADLSEIYEKLSLYLLIKERFGDAADWNLKQELCNLDKLINKLQN